MMADDYLAEIKRVPADHGITAYHKERRRPHRAVVVARRPHITVTFPATGRVLAVVRSTPRRDLRPAIRRAAILIRAGAVSPTLKGPAT
jgi:hypothetical protein